MVRQEQNPYALELEGPSALRLLAHPARQRVINEVYDGRELTATEAAELCGLTPSAMSYHLRMLEKAGVLVPVPAEDGRERRYRRAARSFQVRRTSGYDNRVQMKATVAIWLDTLNETIQRWLGGDERRSGGMHTYSLRLTEAENEALSQRLGDLFREYDAISDAHGPEVPRWETYIAHVPKVENDGDRSPR